MKCPNCGFCNDKTDRKKNVTGKDKEKFVKKHLKMIAKHGMDRSMIERARTELGYSAKTVATDIASSILNEYDRYVTRSPRKVGQH